MAATGPRSLNAKCCEGPGNRANPPLGPAVAAECARRWPRATGPWSYERVRALVLEGRERLEKALDRAGMLAT